MKKYIFKRVLLGLLVLAGVVTITFFLTRVLPSNPAAQWVGPRATKEQIEAATVELGLDKPLLVQFQKYTTDLLHGNLGVSLRTKQPVLNELKSYIPPTLELVIISTILAVMIGIPLGLYSAKKKDKLLDHFCRFFSVGAVSLPTFWVALFLQLIFYRWLQLLPLGGQLDAKLKLLYSIPKFTGLLTVDTLISGNMKLFFDAAKHIVLPAVTISLYPIGLVARMTRSALLEILGEDYIKAARSYGLKENLVLWKYALKNSLGTTATVLALSIGYTLVNTFLVEAIFNWPGIGNYISTAVMSMDYPAIIGVTLFSACSYVILNLLADIIIAIDPRVRV
ncbi:MAG: ABC transporter permease [Sedimentibacter sp.]|uniref:ABC transporter permease n=1 Tax=Sedimentibacter sp. TaxID=1960295 RepID=UPI003158F6DE